MQQRGVARSETPAHLTTEMKGLEVEGKAEMRRFETVEWQTKTRRRKPETVEWLMLIEDLKASKWR